MIYENQAVAADPIHHYIPFTVPEGKQDEATEKEIIDSPWMQRLRYINQLQSARWVYPSAEHSRFVHALGVMHIASLFSKHLYPSLKEQQEDAPSFCFVESLLRLAGLVHDIGHGPFCHFFDEHFLQTYRLTHERLGQWIVLRELAPLLVGIRRSPSGPFEKGEQIFPEYVAFLMGKDPEDKDNSSFKCPAWLAVLKPLFSGIFTVDNLDYVLRDAYMCGVAVGPIDLHRLIYYTFFTKEGLTLHKAGLPALKSFLHARSYLYSNVYYHRTTRAIDIHLREIFPDTLEEIFPYHPQKRLQDYLHLTDWSLLQTVASWKKARSRRRRTLFAEWEKILLRNVKWKMAYETSFSDGEDGVHAMQGITGGAIEKEMRRRLPARLKSLPFHVDMASQDPRPIHPFQMGDRQLYVYDPSNRSVSKEALAKCVDSLPALMIQCRLFVLNHPHDLSLSRTMEETVAALFRSKKEAHGG